MLALHKPTILSCLTLSNKLKLKFLIIKMSWSREQVTYLIDEYKKHPCLYAVKSKDYKNKHSRTRALEAIQQSLLVVKPNVTINEIKTKFHGLKTNFLTEYRKQQKSIVSGAADDDIYVPTIWYFDDMNFVLDHCLPRASVDAIPIIVNTDDLDNSILNLDNSILTEDMDNSQYDLVLPEDNYVENPSLKAIPTSKEIPEKKRKRRNSSDKFLEEASDAVKQMSEIMAAKRKKPQAVPRNGHEVFAEYVAHKLSQMDPGVANEVEENITHLLFEGLRKSKK